MSNIDTSLQGNGDPAGAQGDENPNIRQLRQKADRADELEAKLAKYEQADKLRSAGLDLSEIQQKALLAAHSGESTPEALLETAKQLGFQTPQAQAPAPQAQVQQPTITADEQAAHQQVAAAATGAQVGTQSPEELYKGATNAAELKSIIRANGGALADDFE